MPDQCVKILRQHVGPSGPVVIPLRARWVDPVGDALGAQNFGYSSRLAGILPATLTRRQQNEAAADVEMRTVAHRSKG